MKRSYVLALLTAIFALNFLDRNVLAILLEPIKFDLHVSDTQLGLLVGFAFVTLYTIVGIPIARLADRTSRRDILAFGVVAWSVLTACCGLAANFTQLLLFRIGVGIGEAAGSAPSVSLISSHFTGPARARAISIFASGTYIGIFLGFIMGGYVGQRFGWRTAFLVAAAPGIVLAAILRFTVKEPADRIVADLQPVGTVARFLLGQRTFVLIVAGFALTSVAQFGIGAWAPTYLRRIEHLDGAHTGLAVGAITGLFGILGTWCGGFLSASLAKKNPRALLVIPGVAVIASAVGIAAFAAAPALATALVALAFLVFLQAAHVGPIWTLSQNLVPMHMRSVSFAVMSAFANLFGLGFGPLVVGMLNDALRGSLGEAAIRVSLPTLALFSIAGGTIFLLAARRSTDVPFEGALASA